MTKTEALKAALDGKKISHKSWDSKFYITWDGSLFRTEVGEIYYFNHACDSEWQIVTEPVDFATALKAYRNSATIKSITGEKYSLKREDESLCVNLKEIEGKWLILEDE